MDDAERIIEELEAELAEMTEDRDKFRDCLKDLTYGLARVEDDFWILDPHSEPPETFAPDDLMERTNRDATPYLGAWKDALALL